MRTKHQSPAAACRFLKLTPENFQPRSRYTRADTCWLGFAAGVAFTICVFGLIAIILNTL